jgi:hypothetical protein
VIFPYAWRGVQTAEDAIQNAELGCREVMEIPGAKSLSTRRAGAVPSEERTRRSRRPLHWPTSTA